MAKTISNVLTGVATLYIRQPNDAHAEWSDTHYYAGTQSARLYKSGSGNAGSTHIQLTPPTGETLATWTTGCAANEYSFWYYYTAVTGNWVQFEFRFEDATAGSEGWVEITAVPHQTTLGTAAWLQYDLASDPVVGFGGWGELGIGDNFFDWDLGDTVSTAEATINALPEVDSASDWVLTRVRLELWESSPERTAWVDNVELNGTTYTIEPGGTGPAMMFSSPGTEIGYTEDGVTVTYTAESAPIMVEEETFPIDEVLTSENCEVTCNMAESSLYNIDKAMAGATLTGSILTLGGGVMKTMNLRIDGTNPAGYNRSIAIPVAVATGTVAQSYKKGEKTVVPVTFKALKGSSSEAVTISDNAA